MQVSGQMKSPVSVVRPDVEYREALQLMQSGSVDHLPVVDDQGTISAVVSEHALVLGASRFLDACAEVGDIALEPAVSVAPGASMADAAALMLERETDCLAVVESGRLVGLFTSRDLLRACAELLGRGEASAGSAGRDAESSGVRAGKADGADRAVPTYAPPSGGKAHPQAAMAG